LQAFADARQRTYWDAANDLKSRGGRDITRISDKFATPYIGGCLAARYKIFPYCDDEMLDALWTSQRDHVAFVDEELGYTPARAVSVLGVSTGVAQPPAFAGPATTTAFGRLRHFINRNILSNRGKTDKVRITLRNGQPTFVYIRERDGHTEYLFPNDLFEEVVGDACEAEALKKDLHLQRLIATTRRGNNRVSYVVKCSLPDGSRPFFVVIRHKPKRTRALNPALALAVPV
jgi:hypothetical protein